MDRTKKAARESLRAYLVIGIILSAVGGILALLTLPHEEVAAFGGSIEEHGSRAGFNIGLTLFYIGSASLSFALLGWAIVLGREASPEPARDSQA